MTFLRTQFFFPKQKRMGGPQHLYLSTFLFFLHIKNGFKPNTIGKSESRGFEFFQIPDSRLPIVFAGTIGNSVIREVGSKFPGGTWPENPDSTAHSGSFSVFFQYIALYDPNSRLFDRFGNGKSESIFPKKSGNPTFFSLQ